MLPETLQSKTVIYDGLLWPADDRECYSAVKAELHNLQLLLRHVTDTRTAVQAGGNCGLWPIELAKTFGRVYTFEPDALNFLCLVNNCHSYPNIVKTQGFLGFYRGQAGLTKLPANCGAHFMEGTGIIPSYQIDDLALPDCGLIALDAEGGEYEALLGAEKTIGKCRPVIVCEEKGHETRYGHNENSIKEFLSALDYVQADRLGNDNLYFPKEKTV